jgi:hypothetical protein
MPGRRIESFRNVYLMSSPPYQGGVGGGPGSAADALPIPSNRRHTGRPSSSPDLTSRTPTQERDHGESNPERRIDSAPCFRYTMIPWQNDRPPHSPGGIRTRSIPRAERGWSASCLPSRPFTSSSFQAPHRSPRFGEEDSNLHHLVQGQAAYRLTDPRECPAGFEPACPAWGAGASPLGQGHTNTVARECGVRGSNPRLLRGRQGSCP